MAGSGGGGGVPASPPTITGISDDTGASSNDGITNDVTPEFRGLADLSDTIEVFVDGQSIGTTIADVNGNWALPYNAASIVQGLLPGTAIFQITAQACNIAGNLSEMSAPLEIQVDNLAPEKPIIDGITDDTGASDEDLVTKNQQLTVHGSGPFNETVEVYVDGVKWGSTVVPASRLWTVDISAANLSEGNHVISAKAVDLAGNYSPSADDVVVTVDLTPPATPTITGISPDTGASSSDKITNVRGLTVTGTGPAGEMIVLTAEKGGVSILPEPFTAQVANDGTWSIDFSGYPLPEGDITLFARSEDTAGNQSVADTEAITIDVTPQTSPVVTGISSDTGTSASDGITSDNTLIVTGTAEANEQVDVELYHSTLFTSVSFTVTANAQGDWSTPTTAALAEGEWQVVALTKDIAGNVALSAVYTVEVDQNATKPVITGISDDNGASPNDGITYDRTLDINGTAEKGALGEVFLDGVSQGTTTANQAGAWVFSTGSTPLAFDTYAVTAKVTDLAGNVSPLSDSFSFTIEDVTAAPPEIRAISQDTGASSSDGITSDNRLVVTGVSAPTATVQVLIDGAVAGQATADSSGSWRFDHTATALADGDHTLTAKILGPAGATSALSQGFAITVDTQITAPTFDWLTDDTGASGTDWVTMDDIPVFGGMATPNATIVLEISPSLPFGTVQADATGKWSSAGASWYTQVANNSFADGTYHVTASVTDVAGNTAAATSPALIVDTHIATPKVSSVTDDSGKSVLGSYTNDADLTFRGTADAGDSVKVLATNATGTVTLGTATALPNGTWSIVNAKTLADGDWSFRVETQDKAGNTAAARVNPSTIIDTTPPTKPVITTWHSDRGYSDSDDLTANKSIYLFGTADRDTVVEVWMSPAGGTPVLFGKATHQNATGTTWSRQWGDGVRPSEGKNTFYVTSRDEAGNESRSDDWVIDFDFSVPVATLDTFSDDTGELATDGVTSDTSLTFGGTGLAGETLMLGYYSGGYDLSSELITPLGKGIVAADGTWSITAEKTLADDRYTIVLGDLAGNFVLDEYKTVTIDTKLDAPSLDTVHNGAGATLASGDETLGRELIFAGKVEPGALVTLILTDSLGGTQDFVTRGDANGTWEINTKGRVLTEDTLKVSLKATDLAGNTAQSNPNWSVVVDRTSPALDFGFGDASVPRKILTGVTKTADNEQVFIVSTEAGATVSFSLPAGIVLKDISKNGTGQVWAPTTPFTTGFTDTFTAIATDKVGNKTTKSFKFTFNPPPDDIALTSDKIGENSASGTAVGTVSVTEAGSPSDLDTLKLIGTSPFALKQTTSGAYELILAAGKSLDYETRSSYGIKLQATDTFGSSYSETIAIKVLDELENVVAGAKGGPLVGSSFADAILGGAGPDAIVGGGGKDRVTMGAGADTFTEKPANFDGVRFTDFTGEDALVFEGATLPAGRFDFTPGAKARTSTPGTLSVDTVGDGTADISFELDGDFSGGTFMPVLTGKGTVLTFETFLPALADQVTLSGDEINGIANQAYLTGDGTSDFKVTLKDMGFAAFNNTLGVYEIDAKGNILDPRLLFANTNTDKSATATITDVDAGHRLGFFVVQDGANWARAIKTTDTLVFKDTSGGTATLDDGADLVLNLNGTAVTERVFHSFDAGMNTNGIQRTVSGVATDGTSLLIGFEDTTNGGDRDYEDVVFEVAHQHDFYDVTI